MFKVVDLSNLKRSSEGNETLASSEIDTLRAEFDDLKLRSLNLIGRNNDCLNEEDKLHEDPIEESRIHRAVNNARESRAIRDECSKISERMEIISDRLAMLPLQSPQEVIMNDIVSSLSTNTINPIDSASHIKTGSKLRNDPQDEHKRPRISSGCDTIIGGYEVSPDDKLAELDAVSKIQTVYGLPKIFMDNRLNFLIHLHRPLESMLSKTVSGKKIYPDPNSLDQLSRFLEKSRGRSRSPECELLYQVLKATLDVKRMKVKSNPFNLPVLEVGMRLDDELIYICISELYSEYRTAWFCSMKNIHPPGFQSEYSQALDKYESQSAGMRRSARRSRRHGSQSSFVSIL